MDRYRAGWVSVLPALIVALSACDIVTPGLPPDNEALDGTIEGLTSGQIRLHLLGDQEFGRRFSVSDGLGPIFVATSCEQCHVGDGKGHPAFSLRRFGRSTASGFDPMPGFGGSQLQNRSIAGHPPETVPAAATGVAGVAAVLVGAGATKLGTASGKPGRLGAPTDGPQKSRFRSGR